MRYHQPGTSPKLGTDPQTLRVVVPPQGRPKKRASGNKKGWKWLLGLGAARLWHNRVDRWSPPNE